MLKKLSLNAKLISMFTVSAFLLLVVGLLGVYAIGKTETLYTEVTTRTFPNMVAIQNMRMQSNEAFKLLLQMTLPGNNQDEQKRLAGKLNDAEKEFAEQQAIYEAIQFIPGEKEIAEKFLNHWKAVSKHIDEVLPLATSGSPADRAAFADDYRSGFQKIRHGLYPASDELLKFHEKDSARIVKEAHDLAISQTRVVIALVCGGFLLSLFMGFFFSRGLSRQLTSLSEELVQGATQLNSAASEIATSSENLSSSSAEQAAAVQQTSSAVVELSSMVSRNSDNAEKSKDKAVVSQQVAQRGREVVTEMMKAIFEINESNNNIMKAVEESNRNISDISRVIMDIGAKTNVIKDIVFQTKLLSFNASVEAARAGEHGKGFSVVAEEVGNLAQMSGNAAQEISSTLEDSIKKVNQIVVDTKQRVETLVLLGKEKVDKGHSIAGQCGEILEQIVAEAADVSSMVIEISGSSKEQTVGIQEITKAMEQMDTVTQQNASVSQTSASASVELAAQSESLSSLVSQMQQIIYGKSDSAQHRVLTGQRAQERNQGTVVKLNKNSRKRSALNVPSYDDFKASGDV